MFDLRIFFLSGGGATSTVNNRYSSQYSPLAIIIDYCSILVRSKRRPQTDTLRAFFVDFFLQ